LKINTGRNPPFYQYMAADSTFSRANVGGMRVGVGMIFSVYFRVDCLFIYI